MPMPRTRHEREAAAADAEAWLDSLDPDTTPATDVTDLRRIGEALGRVADAETELEVAVADARRHGRTWTDIGLVLGVSKQAARQRFGTPADTRS